MRQKNLSHFFINFLQKEVKMLKNKQLYGIIKVVFKILKMEVSNMVKKLCSILMIIMLLLNSSLLTIISTAVEDVSNTEKISMDLIKLIFFFL